MDRSREELVKQLALDVGFSVAGIAPATPHERTNRIYQRWLADDKYGQMAWLERHAKKRSDPRSLLPDAKSAICVGLNYYQEIEREQRHMNGSDGRGAFSIYVHGEDYHAVMDRMLADLAGAITEHFSGARWVACADIQPISDRAMALRSGIAWLGKNTAAITPGYGSWVFLGELLTTLDLSPDPPLETLCGSCTRCIDACPTGALDTPFVLDANKCISYLTIEKRGEIPEESHRPIGLDVYGCDTCQSVCPFNDVARQSIAFRNEDRSPLVDMSLDELGAITDEDFREKTKGSAIRRCKPEGIRRNAWIVKKNVSVGKLVQPAMRFQEESGK